MNIIGLHSWNINSIYDCNNPGALKKANTKCYSNQKEISVIFDYSFEDTTCGSPPGVMMADTLSFNAKIGVVDFWV